MSRHGAATAVVQKPGQAGAKGSRGAEPESSVSDSGELGAVFKKLFVYVNSDTGRQPVVEEAARVASRNGGYVRVVMSTPEVPWHALRLGVSEAEARARLDGRARDRLNALVAPHRRAGLSIDLGLLQGTPFLSVIRAAEDGRYDVILKQAEDLPGEGPGTTALHLVRKASKPVWIYRPVYTSGPPRVLAAVDVDPNDLQRQRRVRQVLDVAARFAEATKSELHAVYAYEPLSDSAEGLAPGGGAKLADLVRRTLDEAVSRAQVAAEPHVVAGEPAGAIVAEAARLGAHTLVLASVGRVLPGLLVGDTAERILMRARCSVLAIKPEGFATPVLPPRLGME